jgi:hypothetical protein
MDRLICASNESNVTVMASSSPVSNASLNTTKYTYDAAGRLATSQSTGQAVITYSYDNGNWLTGMVQGNNSTVIQYEVSVVAAAHGGAQACCDARWACPRTGKTNLRAQGGLAPRPPNPGISREGCANTRAMLTIH